MSRTRSVLGLVLFSVFFAFAGAASAQGMGGGGTPPMPMSVDMSKVPVGTWADYTMTVAKMPPMKMRLALVGKADKNYSVETVAEGGIAAAAGGKVAMQTTLSGGGGNDVKIQKMVMQMGPNDPMEMPIESMGGAQQFQKPDPKLFVKDETIKVPAGSFKTKRYKNKTAQGDTVEFWISDSVYPVGLVKMEGDQQSNPSVKGKVVVELTATGKDAKAVITKKPKPFDQQALMQQMMGAKGGGAKGAPPPSAPPPAAPKKK